MTHHEDLGNQHRKLLKQLELAKQFMEKKHKHWKANRTSDSARFAFQDAIGLVNQLEKKLWQFQ
jgi:non-homologous end joining protein Ku